MLQGLQYLRAIAATMIVLHHAIYRQNLYANNAPGLYVSFLPGGVDMFFIISGFIMYYITNTKSIGVKKFIIHRIIRVAPVYYFWTAAFIIFYSLYEHRPYHFEHVVRSALFIPTYHPEFPPEAWAIWPPLVVGWTLNYEMFFYMIFAAGIFIRFPGLFVLVLLPFMFYIGERYSFESAVLVTYTSPMLLEFLFGVIFAMIYLSKLEIKPIFGLISIALGVSLFPYFSENRIDSIALGNGWYVPGAWVINRGLPALLIVGGVLILEKAKRIPHLRALSWLGATSYSLYLSHTLIIEQWGRPWRDYSFGSVLPDSFLTIIGVIICIICGGVFFHAIEQPIIAYLRKMFEKAQLKKSNNKTH